MSLKNSGLYVHDPDERERKNTYKTLHQFSKQRIFSKSDISVLLFAYQRLL